ncbi:DUF4245 domain-containing protein [Actinocrispum sp. NPDC049592]|uniref:DUF4245 domain-containing protein n=1 Tax=Actinocrispum sp. NPDC049592 TaxID=3154835 RepID=UPI00341F82E1
MASEQKPRARQSARDMILSLAVLLVIIGATVWLTRGCQFSPNGPTIDPSSLPTVDANRELSGAARRVDFPVRAPAVPAGWRSNSSNTVPIGTGADATTAVRVGWITSGGNYLRLSQSKAAADALVVMEAGGGISPDTKGTVDVADTKWTKYPGRGTELSWVTSLAGTQVLITGNGTPDEFQTLAQATQTAQPLPTT